MSLQVHTRTSFQTEIDLYTTGDRLDDYIHYLYFSLYQLFFIKSDTQIYVIPLTIPLSVVHNKKEESKYHNKLNEVSLVRRVYVGFSSCLNPSVRRFDSVDTVSDGDPMLQVNYKKKLGSSVRRLTSRLSFNFIIISMYLLCTSINEEGGDGESTDSEVSSLTQMTFQCTAEEFVIGQMLRCSGMELLYLYF